MKSLFPQWSSCWAPAALAVGIAACGGTKQVQAQSPQPTPPLAVANVQAPSATNTTTVSSVVIAPEILRACNIPDTDAYFRFDSAQLTAFDRAPLDSLVTCFTRGPLAGKTLRLVGHADPRGASEYNMTLGQSRADAVAGYLKTQGLDAKQATTTSRGAMDATGQEETGWAHDRRVEILLGQ